MELGVWKMLMSLGFRHVRGLEVKVEVIIAVTCRGAGIAGEDVDMFS